MRVNLVGPTNLHRPLHGQPPCRQLGMGCCHHDRVGCAPLLLQLPRDTAGLPLHGSVLPQRGAAPGRDGAQVVLGLPHRRQGEGLHQEAEVAGGGPCAELASRMVGGGH